MAFGLDFSYHLNASPFLLYMFRRGLVLAFSTNYAYCIASRIIHISTIYWGRTIGAV